MTVEAREVSPGFKELEVLSEDAWLQVTLLWDLKHRILARIVLAVPEDSLSTVKERWSTGERFDDPNEESNMQTVVNIASLNQEARINLSSALDKLQEQDDLLLQAKSKGLRI